MAPRIAFTSDGFTPDARTSITAWPGAGSGQGAGSNRTVLASASGSSALAWTRTATVASEIGMLPGTGSGIGLLQSKQGARFHRRGDRAAKVLDDPARLHHHVRVAAR